MDKDSINKRININSVVRELKKRDSSLSESEYKELAYEMIKEFNKRITDFVVEFEKGDGFFDSSYFAAKDKM